MSNKKKKYEIKIGSNNLPKLSVFTHATNEKEAVENYIKYVVNGLGLAEIFQIDDNDIIQYSSHFHRFRRIQICKTRQVSRLLA